MQILRTVPEAVAYINSLSVSQDLGFVPTMGALHEGHITLLSKAKSENQIAGVSIFVNPLQFNNTSDFTNYPIDTDKDIEKLRNAGADFLFIPQKDELLKQFNPMQFDLGTLDKVMEGPARPGHFQGVANIVHLLFSIIKPNRAYFGEKDFQQLAVIKHMVKSLSLPVEIVGCPTIREKNGLALSSRNRRLSEAQKELAAKVSVFICTLNEKYPENTPTESIRADILMLLDQHGFRLDYFEICDAETLEPCPVFIQKGGVNACIAYFAGEVRLIDNCRYPVLS